MFKSLRWRLQVWHAVVLLIVLTSFGGVVYGLHWRNRLQQIDAELHRTTNAVMSQSSSLVPRPVRRDAVKSEPESGTRAEQNQTVRTETATTETGIEKSTRSQDTPLQDQASRDQTTQEQTSRDQRSSLRRPPREPPGPPPPQFEELFHGDEESRFYYIIWDSRGIVLNKSDFVPSIGYPDLHPGSDGLPVRLPRDRRGKSPSEEGADHNYREVVSAFRWRQPRRSTEQGPVVPNDWNILVGRSIEKDIAAQNQSGLRLMTIGLIILAAGGLGGGWLSARAIRPITAMTATAEAISAQNLSERIDVKDTDSELGNLATVLNASFDRLQAAVERQRQFTADASHELRTPLSVIAAHTELALSRQRSNEEYQATIETCWRASQRMKSLIDSLLLLARFDSGTPSLKSARMNLESLVRDSVELVEPLASARGIQIECQTASCPVWGDSDRLSQVITNLLTNAIRYNVEGGSIRVTTRMESATAVMSVADSGVGIAPDQLPRIFDRFYQVDKARSRAEGSCGLGLSICKTIVEAHGGSITATSQVDVGTTLQVRLPVKAENVASGERESNERQLVSSLANA